MQIPNEFFTLTSFATLGGTAGAVWLITSVLGYLMPIGWSQKYKEYQKFVALGLSIALAFNAAVLVSDETTWAWWLVTLNGLLIFATAVGTNTITNGLAGRLRAMPRAPDTPTPSKFTDLWL